MSRKRMFFSSAKAARELGYRWRPPAARLRGCRALVPRAWHASAIVLALAFRAAAMIALR